MQNNIFSKINISTRMLMLILLSVSLLVSNSIYFTSFFTILVLILLILINKSVKFYVNFIKNLLLWLLFVFITYIIIVGSMLDAITLVYKVILICLLLKQFSLTINFQDMLNGVKTLLKPLTKIANVDEISYDIVIFIYFMRFYMEAGTEIQKKYIAENKLKYFFSLKYSLFPKLFSTISKIKKLESSTKLKYYNPKFEDNNKESKLALVISIILFIIVIFKEVIL